jgi:hypothetical protein
VKSESAIDFSLQVHLAIANRAIVTVNNKYGNCHDANKGRDDSGSFDLIQTHSNMATRDISGNGSGKQRNETKFGDLETTIA